MFDEYEEDLSEIDTSVPAEDKFTNEPLNVSTAAKKHLQEIADRAAKRGLRQEKHADDKNPIFSK